jgi:hypothetical protein
LKQFDEPILQFCGSRLRHSRYDRPSLPAPAEKAEKSPDRQFGVQRSGLRD